MNILRKQKVPAIVRNTLQQRSIADAVTVPLTDDDGDEDDDDDDGAEKKK